MLAWLTLSTCHTFHKSQYTMYHMAYPQWKLLFVTKSVMGDLSSNDDCHESEIGVGLDWVPVMWTVSQWVGIDEIGEMETRLIREKVNKFMLGLVWFGLGVSWAFHSKNPNLNNLSSLKDIKISKPTEKTWFVVCVNFVLKVINHPLHYSLDTNKERQTDRQRTESTTVITTIRLNQQRILTNKKSLQTIDKWTIHAEKSTALKTKAKYSLFCKEYHFINLGRSNWILNDKRHFFISAPNKILTEI